jgi:hypothetical protein
MVKKLFLGISYHKLARLRLGFQLFFSQHRFQAIVALIPVVAIVMFVLNSFEHESSLFIAPRPAGGGQLDH